MKLWQTNQPLAEKIESFTIGKDRELDLILAPFDVYGSMAHVIMLKEAGLLTKTEKNTLLQGLAAIFDRIQTGAFVIQDHVEDVHSQIEWELTQTYGEVGKKLHTGRSRNDQVLVDLRLYFRSAVEQIVKLTDTLIQILLEQAEKHKDQLMPGYTHLQVGMVSSFGLWYSAYAESLIDDTLMLQGIFKIINQNPLGSAAGYGSSFPLKRVLTTRLLGFEDLCYNSIHAQMGRGKTELNLAFGIAGISQTIAKFAMDIGLFCNQNFGFIELPIEMTTGSSIMPHKKNPDVFELIRGRCNYLTSIPQQVLSITNNLPSGYHREFQLIKEIIFPALQQLESCLDLMAFAIPQIKVKSNLLEEEKYRFIYSVEAVNKLVSDGTPFRTAYQEIAKQIQHGTFEKPDHVNYSHVGSVGNLGLKQIAEKQTRTLNGFPFDRIQKRLEELFVSQNL